MPGFVVYYLSQLSSVSKKKTTWKEKKYLEKYFYCKMSLSKPDRKMKQSFGSRKSTFILPREIWIYIWEFLDFETLQKECTLVSKTWLKDIRKTASLSGEMRLKLPKKLVNLTAQNINNVLSRWKKLKVLHVSSRYVL